MKGIKRLEVKLDGVRVIAVVQGATCTLYSRNGKEFENFPQVSEAIEANRKAFQYGRGTGGNFVLDGEIVGESFQALMKQAQRKSNAKTAGMVYHIFDIIPLDALKEGHCNIPQNKRIDWIDSAKAVLDQTDCLRIMPGMNVDLDTAEGHDVMQRFAQASVEQGYEGIMIKNLDAPYECKRSDFWMKWKPTITVDLTIVGFEEGTGRNLGRLGAIIYEGVDNERNIRVNVGTGYSDSDRDEFWAARDQLLGVIGEIEADAVTQNQDGSYSLRFPRHKRFRGFEAGEKL
jgi:DNA ligase-1